MATPGTSTKLINIRTAPHGWESNPEFVYIGRPGNGVDGYFGNPITKHQTCMICGKIHSTASSTIRCFGMYFYRRIQSDPEFKQRVHNLEGKTLVCFCLPKPCHGRVYIDYLNSSELFGE